MTHLNIRSVAIVSTLALCIAVPAQAQRREARNPHQGSSAVLGEVGLFLPTQDGMTTGPAVEGAYEYYLTARNSLRLGAGWANPKLDREHSDSTRQVRLGADLIHNWEGGAVHPFVGAGVGSYFLTLFGRSDRVTACACERNGEVTLPQLLHLTNGADMQAKVRSEEGRLANLLKAEKDDQKVIDEVFLATVSKLPTASQREAVKEALAGGDPREQVFQDLFWALLNSKEFAFNR